MDNKRLGLVIIGLGMLNEQYGVKGSPTLVINDAIYSGKRTPEAFKQAICSAFITESGECSETLSGIVSSQQGDADDTPPFF